MTPNSSLIEQAFCRGHPRAEFTSRGMDYHVEFQEAHWAEVHIAVQVNLRTGMRREVRGAR